MMAYLKALLKALALDREYYVSLREAARDERKNAELERTYRESLRHLELYIALVDWRTGGY